MIFVYVLILFLIAVASAQFEERYFRDEHNRKRQEKLKQRLDGEDRQAKNIINIDDARRLQRIKSIDKADTSLCGIYSFDHE